MQLAGISVKVSDLLLDTACSRLAAPQMRLWNQHLETLEQTKTIEGSRALLVVWAWRSWTVTVSEILADFSNADILAKTGLARRVESQQEGDELEQDGLLFLKVLVRAAAQRAWSCLTFSEIPPDSWNRILSNNHQESSYALSEMKTDAEIIQKAISIAQSSQPHPEKQASGSKRSAVCSVLPKP